MGIWKKLQFSNFIIRLTHWEYWPFGIVQLPIIVYWIWLSVRARSFLFFSASNPTILMGGMLGESKYEVLKLIPNQYIPKTVLINASASITEIENAIQENNFSFPVIFKPDLGERGFMVRKISSANEILTYITTLKKDFLIQEFVDLPIECGVFYTRIPNDTAGKVTSIVLKEMLTVTGDGESTLEQLILAKPRAKLQWKKLMGAHQQTLSVVIPKNEEYVLNAIGNHALGTTFLNGEHLINEKLSSTFDQISKQIAGFYFGRYDLRCATVNDLYDGNIKIMELNGCGAEPAHIYHPGFSMWKAIGILFTHWSNMYIISKQNHQRGIPYMKIKEGRILYKKFKAAVQ